MPDLVKMYTSVLVKGAHGTSRKEDVTQEWHRSSLMVQQNLSVATRK